MNRKLLHTPEGVRDIYGKELERKLVIENKLKKVISDYGYESIQTPTFEYFDVFSKEVGTTPSKDLYKFFDKEGNTLVLRPDFTPSIARCAAKYFMESEAPIRFCYAGNTFVNTSNLQGKLKEVTQLGAELINEASVESDAEIISMVIEALKSAGLEQFQVSIGQVEYFKGICEEAGLDEETENELRQYISVKNYFAVQEILQERNVCEPFHSVILQVADVFGNINSLSEARKLVSNKRSLDAVDRLERLYEVLKLYQVQDYISFDFGMLSQYNYYTGIIFRAYTYGVGNAIIKGGRYDNLLNHFGKNAAAIGFVIVIDDLLEALSRQKVEVALLPAKQTIYYTSENFAEQLKKAALLRSEGIAVELVPDKFMD